MIAGLCAASSRRITNAAWYHGRRALRGSALLRIRTRRSVQECEPFWEFVRPIRAGAFGPNDLEQTLRPGTQIHQGAYARAGQNLTALGGLQFVELVDVDAEASR